MKKILNKFHHGAITIIIFPVIIAGIAFKLENIKFQSSDHVHPCHSQEQTTGNSFNASQLRNPVDVTTSFSFLKRQQIVWHSPLKVSAQVLINLSCSFINRKMYFTCHKSSQYTSRFENTSLQTFSFLLNLPAPNLFWLF